MKERELMKYSGESSMLLFLNFLKSNNHEMYSISKEDIKKVEQMAGEKLPEEYRIFLEIGGNGVRFLKGSSYDITEVFNLKKWANELLEEDNSDEVLSTNDFIFFMHQGYQFYFFKLNEGDNPPVYFYEEGKNEKRIIKKFNCLSDFFIADYNCEIV